MPKSEVYSWRLHRDLKRELEEAARNEGTSVGGLLEMIAREWLEGRSKGDEADQRRLHEAARAWIGSISTGRSDLSERTREEVGEILRRSHGGDGSD